MRNTPEIFIFARSHARPGKQAFDHHAELPHTVRFVEVVEPLLDHPFKVTRSARLW